MRKVEYPHGNIDMEGLFYLLQQVEKKELTAEQCLYRLRQSYGGYMVYFPSLNRQKLRLIKECWKAGMSKDETVRKTGARRRWVNRVYRGLEQKQGTDI